MNNGQDSNAPQEVENSSGADRKQQLSKPDGKAGRICRAGFVCSIAAASITLYVLIFFSIRFSNSDIPDFLSIVAIVLFFIAWFFSIAGIVVLSIGSSKAQKAKMECPAYVKVGKTLSIFSLVALIIATTIVIVLLCAIAAGISALLSNIKFKSPDELPYNSYGPYSETSETDLAKISDLKYYEETTLGEKWSLTYGFGGERIELWSTDEEVPKMVGLYVKMHPEFGEKYCVNVTKISQVDAYESALDNAIIGGGDMAPDIYVVGTSSVIKYTQGDMAKFAATYKNLGIDVDNKIREADIAQYSIDVGSRNGEVVALGYQSTAGVMIYNAEIAKDVFGTDDPAEIEKIVGAGSGDWNKFFEAAEKLKSKGYAAISGPEDIWNACEKSAATAWVVDGRLNIDPEREKYMDLAKTITDKGYSNANDSWSQEWYADMRGEGRNKVFAYFGPAWLINYVMTGNSGGNKAGEGTYGQWRVCVPPVSFYQGGTWILANRETSQKAGVAELIEWITLDASDTGLQYIWANGLIDWDLNPNTDTAQDAVASNAVMARSKWLCDFCGGQNIFPAFIEGNRSTSAKALSQYDEIIAEYWKNSTDYYIEGFYGKKEAIENFKKNVNEEVL